MNATTIGRDAERTDARTFIAEAMAGSGSIVVVAGPQGIGKSRFLDSVLAVASERGAVTARATNYETVRAPFGPFADIVETLRPLYPELVPTNTPAGALFDRCFGAATSPTDFTGDRRRLFVVLAEALTRAAKRTPICLIIDDAQWADPETIEFLHYLASSIGRSRVVVFLGVLDTEDDGPAELAISLERFERTARIVLEPLDDRAARELIAFTVPAGKTLPGRTVDDICRLSEGNPLFLAELVHLALAHAGNVVLPRSAEHATRKRLKILDPRHARTIEIAAALGRTFALDDLVTVANVSRVDAIDALRAARDAALLAEHPGLGEGFAFRHEIVRRAVYESMFAAERTSIHRAIATAFEARDALPELLADHWRRAGDRLAAAAYAERAGDAALAVGAYASARDRFCDVLEAVHDDARHAAIARKLATACGALGDASAARTHLVDAIEHYRTLGDDALLTELECIYADVAYRCGDVTGAIEAARHVADAPSARAEDRFTACVSLATYYATRPDVPLARIELARADAFDRGRELSQELRLEWARAIVAMETSQDDSWREPAEVSLAMAERNGDPRVLASTSMNFAAMARECGRADLARPALSRAIEVADANGLVYAAAYARCEVIEELYASGRLDEAHATIRDVVALQAHAPLVRVLLATVGIPVLVDLGIAERYGMVADRALLDLAFEMGERARCAALAAAFAYADAMAERSDDARALIDRGLRDLSSTRYISGALLVFARYGTAQHVAAVRTLFEAEPERRANRSHRALVDAIHERVTRDASHARSIAARALAYAESDGFALLEAYAHELAGDLKGAIAQYENCGAIAHVRRLTPDRTALTKREREVATALREGLANRAIAERLILSERTVENHVAAIFTKLGVRNRGEYLKSLLAAVTE